MANQSVLGSLAPVDSGDVDPGIQADIEKLLAADPEFADATPDDEPPRRLRAQDRAEPEEEVAEAEEPEPEAEEAEEADEPEGDEWNVGSVEDLAQGWGLNEGELLEKLHVKDSAGAEVLLSDIVKQYQEGASVPAITEHIEQLNGQRNEEHLAHDVKINELNMATDRFLDFLDLQPKRSPEEWELLKVQDPGTWAAEKLKEREQKDAVTESLRQLQQHEAQKEQRKDAERDTTLAASRVSLKAQAKKHGQPDWADEKISQASLREIEETLTGPEIGFSMEDLSAFTDYRYMQVAWLATQYLKTLKQGKVKVRKAKGRVPNFATGAARRDLSRDSRKGRADRFARAKESGTAKDAASAIEDLLGDEGIPN